MVSPDEELLDERDEACCRIGASDPEKDAVFMYFFTGTVFFSFRILYFSIVVCHIQPQYQSNFELKFQQRCIPTKCQLF